MVMSFVTFVYNLHFFGIAIHCANAAIIRCGRYLRSTLHMDYVFSGKSACCC